MYHTRTAANKTTLQAKMIAKCFSPPPTPSFPLPPMSAKWHLQILLCQTILLVNGESLRGERVNNMGSQKLSPFKAKKLKATKICFSWSISVPSAVNETWYPWKPISNPLWLFFQSMVHFMCIWMLAATWITLCFFFRKWGHYGTKLQTRKMSRREQRSIKI